MEGKWFVRSHTITGARAHPWSPSTWTSKVTEGQFWRPDFLRNNGFSNIDGWAHVYVFVFYKWVMWECDYYKNVYKYARVTKVPPLLTVSKKAKRNCSIRREIYQQIPSRRSCFTRTGHSTRWQPLNCLTISKHTSPGAGFCVPHLSFYHVPLGRHFYHWTVKWELFLSNSPKAKPSRYNTPSQKPGWNNANNRKM